MIVGRYVAGSSEAHPGRLWIRDYKQTEQTG